jgi:hypothetical protein
MPLRLGIDIACRAAHQVQSSLMSGRSIWIGPPVPHHAADPAGLWTMLPEDTDPAEALVVMELTNARVSLATWFRRHGPRRRHRSAGALGGSA